MELKMLSSKLFRACKLIPRRVTVAWHSRGARDEESPLRRLLDGASSFAEADVADANPELRWATQPYAHRPAPTPPEQVDPRETSVLLFPGQGAQHVGMGKRLVDYPAARELYDLASEVVGSV